MSPKRLSKSPGVVKHNLKEKVRVFTKESPHRRSKSPSKKLRLKSILKTFLHLEISLKPFLKLKLKSPPISKCLQRKKFKMSMNQTQIRIELSM